MWRRPLKSCLAIPVHEEIFGDQLNDFDKALYTRKLGEIYFRRGEHDKALESFKKAFNLLGMAYPFTRWRARAVIVRQICLEMGRCLQDIGHLESARSIFQTIKAKAEFSRVDAQIALVEKLIP
jgi:tetratricopeptide (TPR) repeat protein